MSHQALPRYVAKYFWGDDISQLSLENNSDYIIQTLLNIGDQKAVKWLLSIVDRDMVRHKLPQLKLTPKSANFWNIYLS